MVDPIEVNQGGGITIVGREGYLLALALIVFTSSTLAKCFSSLVLPRLICCRCAKHCAHS